MGTDMEICRLCIREVNRDDAEDIDLAKLRDLIRTNVVPKWGPEDFRNHIICHSCISNCRTAQALIRCIRSSNATLMNFQKNPQKFKTLNNKYDLRLGQRFKDVPEDVEICRCCMEGTSDIAIYLYDNRVNILPLDYVKMMLKELNISMIVIEETLRPILCCKCWQRLQVTYAFRAHLNLATEKVKHYRRLLQTNYENKNDLDDIRHMWHNLAVAEPNEEDDAEIMPTIIPPETMKLPQLKICLDKYDLSNGNNLQDNDDMPLLSPVFDLTSDTKDTYNTRSRRGRKKATAKHKSTRKTPAIKKLQTPYVNTRPRTRLSTKNNNSINNTTEKINDPAESDFNDLLMVTKEEIIKPQKWKKLKPKPVVEETLTDPKDSNVQYTFERWNFDNEVSYNSDTDDEFVEGTTPLNNSNDKCPVISPEPEEILELDDYDDYDTPPLLELQGPCQQYDSSIMMSKPYTINDKRLDIKQQLVIPERDPIMDSKARLSVRTDLLEQAKPVEPSKTVEPLRINLTTMEVSNKPSPAPSKAVKIHSNEIILPKYQLRKSEVDYRGYFYNASQPPQLTTSTAKKPQKPSTAVSLSASSSKNDEFRAGDCIRMSFGCSPISPLKRQSVMDSGLVEKRPRPNGIVNNEGGFVKQPETGAAAGESQLSKNQETRPQPLKKPETGGVGNNETRDGNIQRPGAESQVPKKPETGANISATPSTGDQETGITIIQHSINRKPQLGKKPETGETGNNKMPQIVRKSETQRPPNAIVESQVPETGANRVETKISRPSLGSNRAGSQLTGRSFNDWRPQLSKKPSETGKKPETRVMPQLVRKPETGATGQRPQVPTVPRLSHLKGPERHYSQPKRLSSMADKKIVPPSAPKLPQPTGTSKITPRTPGLQKIAPHSSKLSPNLQKPSAVPRKISPIRAPSTPPITLQRTTQKSPSTSSSTTTSTPSHHQNYPLIQKVMFLTNGELVLVDQPLQVSEFANGTTEPPQTMTLQHVTTGNPLTVKVPPSEPLEEQKLFVKKVVPGGAKSIQNQYILISSDDEDDVNGTAPSTIESK